MCFKYSTVELLLYIAEVKLNTEKSGDSAKVQNEKNKEEALNKDTMKVPKICGIIDKIQF